MNSNADKAVNLEEKFAKIQEYWSPGIVAELNGQHVKLAKLKGEFIWHRHDDEDELFLVVKGTLTIRLRDKDVVLNPGEFFVVPKGTDHLPIADEEVHVVLLEPISTVNTGTTESDRTVHELDWLE